MKSKSSLFIILASFLVCACSDGVEIKNQNWKYENQQCKVNFTIVNNDHTGSLKKIKIAAYRQRKKGKGAMVNDLLGEKMFFIELKPKEVLEVEEIIKLRFNKRPTMVIVKPLESK